MVETLDREKGGHSNERTQIFPEKNALKMGGGDLN